ncbi:MAG: DUF2213 domain-containing protein [Azoarcus sp.]|jgi:hypothetical protein|nr:DUF2213 domain-containing protein [Azoarcus sp.]
MLFQDSLTLDASGLTRTRDGYLIGDARVSRAGNVQQYLGRELGLTGDDAAKVFGVFRDPDAVFDEGSMMSLAGRPVTRGHPEGAVTADNWKELAKGQVAGVIRKDGEHVVAPMAIMDAAAAAEVERGARSLSAGYTCELIADSGTAATGEAYQFRQSKIRFNHVAYLPDNNPRAGNTRIGDDNTSGEKSIILAEFGFMCAVFRIVAVGCGVSPRQRKRNAKEPEREEMQALLAELKQERERAGACGTRRNTDAYVGAAPGDEQPCRPRRAATAAQ